MRNIRRIVYVEAKTRGLEIKTTKLWLPSNENQGFDHMHWYSTGEIMCGDSKTCLFFFVNKGESCDICLVMTVGYS